MRCGFMCAVHLTYSRPSARILPGNFRTLRATHKINYHESPRLAAMGEVRAEVPHGTSSPPGSTSAAPRIPPAPRDGVDGGRSGEGRPDSGNGRRGAR